MIDNVETATSSDTGKPRRGPVACKRCRRLRSKCSHEGRPPCTTCSEAGLAIATECTFPTRGERDFDRQYRVKKRSVPDSDHARCLPSQARVDSPHTPQSTPPNAGSKALAHETLRHLLPPHGEVIDGFRVFIDSYFQLGFIPKAVFLERLSREPNSIGVFLLLTILGISARFTPSLIRRYGSGSQATAHFLRLASTLVPTEMYDPSLERVQAFFLLSISEWGDGDKNRSFIHMGVAIRMASILRLHREETYCLAATASSEEIVEAEMARRTFWMIQSQDNLHSGHSTPMPFSPSDITALLPSEESDFAFGTIPHARAALHGTPPAVEYPHLVNLPTRSLFATLIQAHNLWGTIARRACRTDGHLAGLIRTPWVNSSEYMQLSQSLQEWEDNLPSRHRWSVWNLRGYKAESQDLAYLSVVMVLRLSSIVLRRIYLDDLIEAAQDDFDQKKSGRADFWQTMSYELFANVLELHEQIDAYFPLRSKEEGYPAILVFCVYVCGSLASYLWKWPNLCPHLAPGAEKMAIGSLNVLNSLQHAWPTARRWSLGLQHVASPLSEKSSSPTVSMKTAARLRYATLPEQADAGSDLTNSKESVGNNTNSQEQVDRGGSNGKKGYLEPGWVSGTEKAWQLPTSSAMGAFEADFTAFLQGDLNYGFLDGWQLQPGL